MRLNLRSTLRAFAVSTALLAIPSLAGASFIARPNMNDAANAPITFNPTSVLINLQIGQSGSATFRIHERGYHGAFHGKVTCLLPLGKPRLDIDGNKATVFVPKQLIAIDIGCSAAIRGAGNRIGIEPILISISL